MKKVEDTTRGIVAIFAAVYKDIQTHPEEAEAMISDIKAQGKNMAASLTTFYTTLQHIFALVVNVSDYLEGKVSRDLNPDRLIQTRRIGGALQEQFPELSGTIVEHPSVPSGTSSA